MLGERHGRNLWAAFITCAVDIIIDFTHPISLHLLSLHLTSPHFTSLHLTLPHSPTASRQSPSRASFTTSKRLFNPSLLPKKPSLLHNHRSLECAIYVPTYNAPCPNHSYVQCHTFFIKLITIRSKYSFIYIHIETCIYMSSFLTQQARRTGASRTHQRSLVGLTRRPASGPRKRGRRWPVSWQRRVR